MEVETADGVIFAVSIEAQINAVVDACVMSNRAGGGFSVWYDRFPTGLPGEMVTTGAIIEWRDRTDAKAAPERSNGTAQVVENPEPPAFEEPPPEDDPTQYRGGELRDDIGDGIDPNALPEEDDSEVGEVVG
jgi:hypothetical protein